MANAFYGDRWVIDTPSNNMITNQSIFVKHVRWTGDAVVGSSGAAEAKITDASGQTRWDKRALAATVAYDDQIENWWYEGFKCTVLDGGILIIDLK